MHPAAAVRLLPRDRPRRQRAAAAFLMMAVVWAAAAAVVPAAAADPCPQCVNKEYPLSFPKWRQVLGYIAFVFTIILAVLCLAGLTLRRRIYPLSGRSYPLLVVYTLGLFFSLGILYREFAGEASMDCGIKMWTQIMFFPLCGGAVLLRIVRVHRKSAFENLKHHQFDQSRLLQLQDAEAGVAGEPPRMAGFAIQRARQDVSAARRAASTRRLLRWMAGFVAFTLAWGLIRHTTDPDMRAGRVGCPTFGPEVGFQLVSTLAIVAVCVPAYFRLRHMRLGYELAAELRYLVGFVSGGLLLLLVLQVVGSGSDLESETFNVIQRYITWAVPMFGLLVQVIWPIFRTFKTHGWSGHRRLSGGDPGAPGDPGYSPGGGGVGSRPEDSYSAGGLLGPDGGEEESLRPATTLACVPVSPQPQQTRPPVDLELGQSAAGGLSASRSLDEGTALRGPAAGSSSVTSSPSRVHRSVSGGAGDAEGAAAIRSLFGGFAGELDSEEFKQLGAAGIMRTHSMHKILRLDADQGFVPPISVAGAPADGDPSLAAAVDADAAAAEGADHSMSGSAQPHVALTVEATAGVAAGTPADSVAAEDPEDEAKDGVGQLRSVQSVLDRKKLLPLRIASRRKLWKDVELADILRNPLGQRLFAEHLHKEWSLENLMFWEAVQTYIQICDAAAAAAQAPTGLDASGKTAEERWRQAQTVALHILEDYIEDNGPWMVNISSNVRRRVVADIQQHKRFDRQLFDAGCHEVWHLMAADSFRRFTEGPLFQQLRAGAVIVGGPEWREMFRSSVSSTGAGPVSTASSAASSGGAHHSRGPSGGFGGSGSGSGASAAAAAHSLPPQVSAGGDEMSSLELAPLPAAEAGGVGSARRPSRSSQVGYSADGSSPGSRALGRRRSSGFLGLLTGRSNRRDSHHSERLLVATASEEEGGAVASSGGRRSRGHSLAVAAGGDPPSARRLSGVAGTPGGSRVFSFREASSGDLPSLQKSLSVGKVGPANADSPDSRLTPPRSTPRRQPGPELPESPLAGSPERAAAVSAVSLSDPAAAATAGLAPERMGAGPPETAAPAAALL